MFELLDGRASAFQWDTGLYVDCTGLAESDEVHFCRPGITLALHPAMQGETLAAPVPDELLQQAQPIIVFAYVQTVTGEITRVSTRLCVTARPKPPGYIASPTEALRWEHLQEQIGDLDDLHTQDKTNLVVALNEAMAQSGQAAEGAVAVGKQLGKLSEEISDCIKAPTTAEVGQTIMVKAIGDDGKPTEWEPVTLPEQVQADWHQNDPTAADYVKNRPFYTGNPVETVLVEESTVTFDDSGEGYYLAEFPSTFEATVGETYKVSWDGTVYERTCVYVQDLPAIGNLSIIGLGSDTGEPFLMGIINSVAIRIFAEEEEEHTFSVYHVSSAVHKLDERYLPETAMKSEYAAYMMPCINADLVKDITYFSNPIADTTYTTDCAASEWKLLASIINTANTNLIVYATGRLIVGSSLTTENNLTIYGSRYFDGVHKIDKTNLQFDETSETLTVTQYAQTL